MDVQFPISELLSPHESAAWLEKHMHPQGLRCPGCTAPQTNARVFRHSKRGLLDHRCNSCQRVYNLYSGTIFAGSRLVPAKAVLLLRGICKGESSLALAAELKLSRTTVHTYRQKAQRNGYAMLEETALSDARTETDEMFQKRGGKKGRGILIPLIHRAAVPTRSVGTALTPTTARRW